MDPKSEIDRLFQLEYGNRLELIVRFFSIFGGGLFLYSQIGWISILFWMGGFLLAHVTYFLTMNRLRKTANAANRPLATLLWVILNSAFIWMPAMLAMQDEAPLNIAGSVVLAATFVFLVRRGDSYLPSVICEIGLVAVTVSAVMSVHLPKVQDMGLRLFIGLIAMLLVFYFAQAIVVARKLRIDAHEAFDRTAQELKLAAIGRLAGGVAHDFNNILTGISGNLELYHEVDDPAERRELIETARTSAHRAETLVRQLLTYTRQTGLETDPIKAQAILDELVTFSRRLIPANIRIECDFDKMHRWILADHAQLMTGLINLIVNAADAMPDGGTISLSVAGLVTGDMTCIDGRPLEAGKYVVMSVADTGHGIEPGNLHRVVEPFYTTKPVGKGTGLGLSMVLGLVQSHGGGLTIDTGPNGTTVRILLPEIPAPEIAQSRDQKAVQTLQA